MKLSVKLEEASLCFFQVMIISKDVVVVVDGKYVNSAFEIRKEHNPIHLGSLAGQPKYLDKQNFAFSVKTSLPLIMQLHTILVLQLFF